MTPYWVSPFLEQLAATGNVSMAARIAGIASTTVYGKRKTDGDFAAAWDQALEDATDVLEQEARRRAVTGIQEPIVHQGQLTPMWELDEACRPVLDAQGNPVQMRDPDGKPMWLTVTKYSDSLLALLLKGRRFKDRTELTGAGGGPVQLDESARVARIAQLLALAKARAEQPDDLSDIA